jgi:hypothetical protein
MTYGSASRRVYAKRPASSVTPPPARPADPGVPMGPGAAVAPGAAVDLDFQRPVSPTEWLYLAGERLAPPFAVQLFVSGAGGIGADELRFAVAAAADLCPGSRLVRSGRVWVDSRATPPVRVVDGPLGGSAFDAPALHRPLDTARGPACEVLLAGGPGGAPGTGSTVGFRAHHAVMDGRGALAWAAEVFRALRGEEPTGVFSRLTDTFLLRELGAVGRRPWLGFGWGSPLPAGRSCQLGRSGLSGRSGDRTLHWRRRTLDGTHPGLGARLAAAFAAAGGGQPSRFMVPVDLRRHAPHLASTANLSLPVFLDVAPGERWDELHARLRQVLADRRELSPGSAELVASRLPVPALAAGLAAAQAVSVRRGRYLSSAVLSHLGRIDLATFSTDTFAAGSVYSLPVHAPFVPVSVSAVESAERTELVLSCQGGPDAAERADVLLDRIAAAVRVG